MTCTDSCPCKGAAPRDADEAAPPNSLPTWSECALIIDNAEFRKRAAAGLEGSVLDTPPTTPEPTELHRFIYEYDDADSYRSAWFLHRLELLLNETRALAASTPVQQDAPSREAQKSCVDNAHESCACPDGVAVVRTATDMFGHIKKPENPQPWSSDGVAIPRVTNPAAPHQTAPGLPAPQQADDSCYNNLPAEGMGGSDGR